MIYTHKELDNYNMVKEMSNEKLYKIESGLYSDTEKYNHLEYIVKNIQIASLHQKAHSSILD